MKLSFFFAIFLILCFGRVTNAQKQSGANSSNRVAVKSIQQKTFSPDSVYNGKSIEPTSDYIQPKKESQVSASIVKYDSSDHMLNSEKNCEVLGSKITQANQIIFNLNKEIESLKKIQAQLEDLLYKFENTNDSSSGSGLTAAYNSLVSAFENTLNIHENSKTAVSIGLQIAAVRTDIDQIREVIPTKIKKLVEWLAILSKLKKEREIYCGPKQKMNSDKKINHRSTSN